MSGRNRKLFSRGLIMVLVFAVVLVAVFMPLFNGQNGLNYLDNLYNSISKKSAYYIPDLQKLAKAFDGKPLNAQLQFKDKASSELATLLFNSAGAKAQVNGAKLKVTGDLGRIMARCLADADAMFNNDGQKLVKLYQGKNEKLMLYAWWQVLGAMETSLNRQKAFAQAKFIKSVQAKAVEMSYNYYKIVPQNISSQWLIVVFSLLFYVIYTLWYGFGVMYMFEGAGYQLEH